MTETTYIAFDVWPEDAEHPYWERDPTPGGATVQLTTGDVHLYVNAFHQSEAGSAWAQHEYTVGSAGQLHVVLTLSQRYSAGTVGVVTTPNGSRTERVLRTYSSGTWGQAEGAFRPDVAGVDPSRNLSDTPG